MSTHPALTDWLDRVADGQGRWLTDSVTQTLEARDIIETLPEENTWDTDDVTVGVAPTPNGGWVAWAISPYDATIVACDTVEEAEKERDDFWNALVEAARENAATILHAEGYDESDVDMAIDSWTLAAAYGEIIDEAQLDVIRQQLEADEAGR